MNIGVNIPETGQRRIVIVGAGFGGLQLALRLGRSDYQVVLLDKNNYHQFQPLFYQVAMAGLEPSSIVFPLRKVFQKEKNVIIRVCTVEEVNPEAKIVRTDLGSLSFDFLVLAMGADTNFFGNERIARLSIPMKSVSEALFLRNAILEDYERSIITDDYEKRQELIDIVVVGGGPTGVEVSGALAEMKKYVLPKDYAELDSREVDIYLIQGGSCLLPGMSEKASEGALRFLENLGVKVKLNTRVTDFDGQFVFMNDDTKILAKKMIWAAGITGNTIKGLPEKCMARSCRIAVNHFHQVIGYDHLYAIGDVACMPTDLYPEGHPQVAQVAMQQANNLAKNLQKKEPRPFEYKDLGSMATIGRHLAVVDLPRFKFQGAFAWLIWLFVHLFQILGIKNKLFIFINWLWNYFTYDQSLRLLIRPRIKKD